MGIKKTVKVVPAEDKYKPISTAKKRELMVQAMRNTLGNVTASCDMVGITRQLHYHWMKKNLKYKAAIEDMSEVAIDFTEAAMMKNIRSGREASIIFYLKTKAKHRGYIEANINLNRDISDDDLRNKSTAELLAILDRKP